MSEHERLHTAVLVAPAKERRRLREQRRRAEARLHAEQRKAELAAGNVVTAGGREYEGDTLQRRINRRMKASGIGHTYHDLRKRGATLALSRTKNPVAVAQMFGWESLQTAQHYARFDGDVLREIAEAMV